MWIKFVLGILACYRLSQMVVYDEGPFRLFDRLRVWAGCYDYGENGQPKSGWGRLLNCPYCVGLWFSIPLAFVIAERIAWDIIVLWLAIAGAQSFLESASCSRKDGD